MRITAALGWLITCFGIPALLLGSASAQQTQATATLATEASVEERTQPQRTHPQRFDGDTIVTRGQIIAVQTALSINGCYGGARDGNWNVATRRAAGRALAAQGIPLDVGQPTPLIVRLLLRPDIATCGGRQLAALPSDKSYEKPPITKSEQPGPGDVVALQAALAANNCYTGSIDGRYGPKTKSALRAFEKRAGIGTRDFSHALKEIAAHPDIACEVVKPSPSLEPSSSSKRKRSAALPKNKRNKRPKIRRKPITNVHSNTRPARRTARKKCRRETRQECLYRRTGLRSPAVKPGFGVYWCTDSRRIQVCK